MVNRIGVKFLNIINDMYNCSLSAIKIQNKISSFGSKGCTWECIVLPILYSIYFVGVVAHGILFLYATTHLYNRMAMVCVQELRKIVAQSPMRVKIQLVDQILMIEIYSSLQVFITNGVSRTALNSVFSFIKMSYRDLKCVYLFCQTDMLLRQIRQ
jgi:hypothetical protein